MNARFTTVGEGIGEVASPLTGTPADYDPLLEAIGDARFILLGEASHGTHEFYRVRAEITQRLITEKHVTAVAVEADWPDAARVNRYVQDHDGDATAEQALAGFQRFPLKTSGARHKKSPLQEVKSQLPIQLYPALRLLDVGARLPDSPGVPGVGPDVVAPAGRLPAEKRPPLSRGSSLRSAACDSR